MAYQNPAQPAPVQDGGGAWNNVLSGIAGARPPGQIPPRFGAPVPQPPNQTTPWAPKGPQMGAPDPYTPPTGMGGPATAPKSPGAPSTPWASGAPPIAHEGPNQMPAPPVPTPPGVSAPRVPWTPPAGPTTPSAASPAPAPGTPLNAAGTPTGAETGQLPSTPLSAYGPGQNLIGSQINPNANPNRMDIANQYFNEMQTASNPAYEASLRDATQRAAATGSLGSGMLNTSYGNLALQRAQNLDTLQRELQTQATEGSIGDQRFNTGVTQQQQAYQAAMAQQALQNRINQLGTEQSIGAGQAGYLAGYNPYPNIYGSQIYGQQAQNAQSQLQQLFGAAGLGGALQGILQPGQNSGVYGNNIYSGGGTTLPPGAITDPTFDPNALYGGGSYG